MRRSHIRSMTLEQQITALADGTLRGRRRTEVEARLAERRDMLVLLERQRRVIAVMRELSPRVPPRLRTRVEEERRRAGHFPRHRFP
jgi:anti-sigma factor RsiW